MTGRAAAFLDRDGTIIRDTIYLNDPNKLEFIPGSADAIRRLNEKGILTVVVTNQSGIARQLITPEQYEQVKRALDEGLSLQGARLDATYMCPHHPDFTGKCDCRKPGTLLFEQAIKELGIDAKQSAFIGDRWRDVQPGIALGGHPWLVLSPSTPQAEHHEAREKGIPIVRSLEEAVSAYLKTRS